MAARASSPLSDRTFPWPIHRFAEVGSTMVEAQRLAQVQRLAGGDAGPFWVAAAQQSAGRGRHGRVWTSPPGNLYATLYLPNPCEAAHAAELGFVAGLALHETVQALTGLAPPRLALKWPNDLLIDRAKVAGLLLEGDSRGQAFSVAIGLGVNIAFAPEATPYPAAALAAHASGLTVDEVLERLAQAMAGHLALWQRDGFGSVRRAWLARAAFLGEEVTLRLGEGPIRGTFETIDASGRIELLTSQGHRVIDAGDLYFGTEGSR